MIDRFYFENRFPKLELSYEKLLHNKVHTDLYLAIPYGEKVYVWFTYYKDRDLCVLLTINKFNLITNVKEIKLKFDRKLSRNTILFGTKFNYMKKEFITIEDIFYYKGHEVIKENDTFKKRLEKIINIFNHEIKQENEQSIVLGLPAIFNNLKECFCELNIIKYKISIIKFINYDDKNFIGYIVNNKIEKEKITIFKIKADIKDDIYKLYLNDGYYDNALINNYKLSVKMNNEFRNIKENRNLDLLEMSDSEDDFENINQDKYVDLNKIIYMKCIYNKNFKKWIPLEKVNYGEKLLNKREVKQIELTR